MKYTLLLLPLAVLFTATATAQRIPLINSGQVLARAAVLQDSDKYDLAIKELLAIPKRDTNYVLMQSRLARLYILNDQLDEGFATAEAVLKHPTEFKGTMLRVKASAREKKKEYDQAIAILQSGLTEYPFDVELRYQLATVYHNRHDYKNAIKAYYDVLAIYPFSANTHLNLGNIALWLGDKTHAMMSFGLYVALLNTDNTKLRTLENIATNQVEHEGQGAADRTGPNAYERLDQILRSKIAMDKNFKTEVPIDVATVRQFEMLFKQLNTAPPNAEDPWMKFYGPIYAAIRDQKMIEPFMYHILSSSPIEGVKKWTSKNQKKLDAFFETINPVIKRDRSTLALPASLNMGTTAQAEYSENLLYGLGGMTSGQKDGKWIYLHSNGPPSAAGNYTAGKKVGEWKYYSSNGTLTSTENEDTGEVTGWHPDGTKSLHYFLKNEVIEGEIIFYYPCGNVSEKRIHKEGKRSGKGQLLYETGVVKADFEYADDVLTNTWTDYDVAGRITEKTSYKEGARDGVHERFWPNGKIRERDHYVAGDFSGTSEGYHANGTLYFKGEYVKGLPVGEWMYYNQKGEKAEQRFYNNDGDLDKENLFYHDGRNYRKQTYNKGIVVQVEYFDEAGKQIAKFGSPDGNFKVKHYFPGGALMQDGQYKAGKRDGKWTRYYFDGPVESEYNYVEDERDGEQLDFYRNGKKEFVSQYKKGVSDGYVQEFHLNGKQRIEGWSVDGVNQQQWLAYYPDGTLADDNYYLNGSMADSAYSYSVEGKLSSRNFFKNGDLDVENTFDPLQQNYFMDSRQQGNRSLNYASGAIQVKYQASCGKLNGALERLYPDGKTYYKYSYTGNELNGLYVSYDNFGNITTRGSYLAGARHGEWNYFNEAGKIDQVARYVNGSTDSLLTNYYGFGGVYQIVEYMGGERNGLTRYLAPDGLPIVEKKTYDNQLVAVRATGKNGQFGDWQPFFSKMSIVAYYPNGAKAYEEEYTAGTLSGAKRIYFPDGKMCQEYHYVDGGIDGTFADYYPNGKICMKGQYRFGELDGVIEAFTENGMPLKTITYKLGRRNGPSSYFVKGVKSKEVVFYNGMPLK